MKFIEHVNKVEAKLFSIRVLKLPLYHWLMGGLIVVGLLLAFIVFAPNRL